MHNRFRQPFETKFGIKPPMSRINFNTLEKSMETALPMVINAPQPIWEVLGITEIEYYEKYHTQPISDNALEIQKTQEKTQEVVVEPLEELPQDVPDVPVS
jgi:hypothetical protein